MSFPSLMAAEAAASGEEDQYRPYLNTGGPLDILNGQFIPAVSGAWILSGGLGTTTGTIATANKYKSSLSNGASVNVMARFDGSHFFLNDTEGATINKPRLARMSTRYLDPSETTTRDAHIADLQSRIHIYSPAVERAETLDAWFDFMKSIRDDKLKRAKEMIVETEVLDPSTGKPYQMMLPTFVGIDSWTEALVRQLTVRNDEFTADTEMSQQRMINMEEGWQKTRLMRQLVGICTKAGIYLTMTGQLGKKASLDGKPVAKDLTYMKQDETTKSMGPKFNYTMSTIFKIESASPIVNSADRHVTDYPSGGGISSTELQELLVTQVRSKNAASGPQAMLVASQSQGMMQGLSYYHALRNAKYYGLGNPRSVRNPIIPDIDLGRTKIYDVVKQYKVERALELTYQLMAIQSTWSMINQPVDYSMPIDKFAEELHKSSYAVDDILNSRGWWTHTQTKVDRPLLTLPDVLAILDGRYQPKFFAVKSPTKADLKLAA